jgi:hypothetical protein
MVTNSNPQPTIPDEDPPSPPLVKPSGFSLDKFKTKRAVAAANVDTLPTALPHHPIAHAKDFTRLHPSDDYWSPELCFVSVPIKGQKKDLLHLIDEDLALQFVSSGKVQRFALALATKPHDVFFLCHIPTRNTDNAWNLSNLQACSFARTRWVQASSRAEENVEAYKVDFAKDEDAFPEPKWPKLSLEQLIDVTFAGRVIDHETHPALLRLIGAKQDLK